MKKYYLIFLLLITLTTGCSKLVSFSAKSSGKSQPTSVIPVPQQQSTTRENIPSFPISIQPYPITNLPKTMHFFKPSERITPPSPVLPSFDSHLPFYLELPQYHKPDTSWINSINKPDPPLPTQPIKLSYAPAITAAKQLKVSEIPRLLPTQPLELSYAPAITAAKQLKVSEIPRLLPTQPLELSYAPAITAAKQFKVSEKIEEVTPPAPLVAFDLNMPYLSQNIVPSAPTLNLPKPVPQVVEQRPQIVERRSQHEFQDTFIYEWSSNVFYQPRLDKNKITLTFKSSDERGFNVNGLQATDMMLIENNKEVQNYTLSSSSQSTHQGLDLVFVINNSGSMKRDVNLIKENIAHLVNTLERSQLIARLCLVTFIDQVTKSCEQFVTDNPSTPQNENLIAFLDEISKLRFHGGGGLNTDNALEGLLVAAQETPWQIGHQRMLVLATDALFWTNIDPRLSNIRGFNYGDVLDVLTHTGVQIFTMTYDYGGFSKDYFKSPSVVEATSGQWFDLKKLRRGDMTIESIVDQVRNQLDTIYRIEYFVEDNTGFNPHLTLEERMVALSHKNLEANRNIRIETQDIHSNMPEGKPHLQSHWLLSRDGYIDNVFVTINNQQETDFFIEDGYIVFRQPPEEGAEITIQYELGDLIDNVKWHPLVLKIDDVYQSADTEIINTNLRLNGKSASSADFEIEPSASGHFHLRLNESVFANEDPFDIRLFDKLDIFLYYELRSSHVQSK